MEDVHTQGDRVWENSDEWPIKRKYDEQIFPSRFDNRDHPKFGNKIPNKNSKWLESQ